MSKVQPLSRGDTKTVLSRWHGPGRGDHPRPRGLRGGRRSRLGQQWELPNLRQDAGNTSDKVAAGSTIHMGEV